MTSTSSINDVAKVAMLDGSVHNYNVKTKSYANTLLQAIMKDLNILEADYFGVQFKDKEGNEVFLDPLKKIRTQMKNVGKTSLKFVVKFFPPDPGELQEEYTRYLVALQIRQDIAAGMLYCHENTLIAMASCIVQADCGDWNPIEHSNSSYVKNLNILPAASNEEDIYEKICDKHKTRIGESPGEADRQLLDIVRRLEHYGLRLHPAKDQENTEIELAAAHLGILIFHGTSKINTFNWSRIRKLSFKKKRFLIKLKHEQNTGSTGDILVFVMASRDTCKNFWRHCVEYHAFFRLEIKTAAPQKTVIRRGSTFRYSGKTQKQLHDLVKNSNFRRTTFVRATSRKYHYAKRRLSGELTSTNNFQTSVVAENGSQVVHNIPVQAEDDAIQYSTPASSPLAANLSPDELTVDEKAASDWQVESKNLHSSSVAAKHDRDGDDAESSTANTVQGLPCKLMSEVDDESSPVPSPVHLHSGGISETKQILESTSSVNLPSPPAALLSTQGLKSTSSPTDSRYPSSPAYYIAKELLTTERTYVRDLEVICVGFKMEMQRVKEGKDRAGGMLSADVSEQLFGGGDALLTLHRRFLTDIDQHLLTWEGRTSLSDHTSREQLVNQLIMNHMIVLKKHLNSIENAAMVISSLEDVARNSSRFESIYREFELQKMCYLPFSSFLLKPMQRILHYNIVLERLVKHYDEQAALAHHDSLSRAARASHDLADALCETLKKAHNLQKMTQLRRDLIGVDNLLSPERSFIREGSLYKLSRKGFQQRLFFLFDDCLLYTSKGVTSTNQFKVHAELPLNGMIIEINDGDNSVPNCFSILSASKTVIVAAASQQEMDKWLEDFSIAISRATRRDHVSNYDSPLTDGAKGSESRLSFQSSEDGDQRNSLETSRIKIPTQQRSNATMHVCWHRNTSVSSADHLVSLKNQLSGYLLRKFKNSNGWQKLWVVFTNFCLFFYKSHQDDFPLASLPLLGYSVSPPADEDNIRKDFVFKLQFKTHVYFFRAESKFTFERWMEVVSSTTATAQRTRLFSRINSNF